MIVCPYCQVQSKESDFFKSEEFYRITVDIFNNKNKEYVTSVACPKCYKVFVDISSIESISVYSSTIK